MLPLIINNQKS